jgi:hypothetical protein
MHETGFIKASPQKIIADGADWRFLNELKTRAESVSPTGRETSWP